MKRILLFIFAFTCACLSSKGQVYFLNNGFTNGSAITTCGGIFYDSHPLGNYTPGENYSVTFCSGSPGKIIQVLFSFITVAQGDTLFVYDGDNVNAPVLDTFTSMSATFYYATPSLSNTTGCLTFRFISDGSMEADGWFGQIKCMYPCSQTILATTATLPLQLTGYTNICTGDTVHFSVATQYPLNNTLYHQADTSTLFHWKFGDGGDTVGKNITSVKHAFSKSGGFYAQLSIVDSNGCSAALPLGMPVRTGLKPAFNITAPPSICLFDTVILKPSSASGTDSVTPQTASFLTLPISGDSVFLPDSPPQCFTSSIVIDKFTAGQTLNNINDLKGIFMKMEHSYSGDITIAITAPNGAKVFLKSTTGGGASDGTFLGEPVDESLNGASTNPALLTIPGKGYEYSFNNTPQYRTMWQESDTYTYSYTDNAGQSVVNHFYLPAGSYQSEQNLWSLVGTPLNGVWTLEICDKQSYDNGFLFSWHLEFSTNLFPSTETYTVPLTSEAWLPAPGLLNINNTVATVSPAIADTFHYIYRVVDGFGCTYDTTISIITNALPSKPQLGADKWICSNQFALLTIANVDAGVQYSWSTGNTRDTMIRVNQPGTYWVQATNFNGCGRRDSVDLMLLQPYTLKLPADTMFCASKPLTLVPAPADSVISWLWNTGDTTPTYTVKDTGTYWVEGKGRTGCAVRDSMHLTHNPVNLFEMPADTTICDRSSYRLSLNPPPGSNLTWYDGSTSYWHKIDHGGTYKVTAEYKGCVHETDIDVGIRPLPIISLGGDTTLCSGYDLPLSAAYNGATYLWSTASTEPSVVVNKRGLYWVQTTLYGCSYRDSIKVEEKICACEIKMPTAFSPNGDGINDVYRPTIVCFPRNYHLIFYNRYGQPVFDSKDHKKLWDGTRNGNILPSAVYYYMLTFYNENLMHDERVSGSVMLVR